MASVSVSLSNQFIGRKLKLAAVVDPGGTNPGQQPNRVSAAYGNSPIGYSGRNSNVASQASLYQVLGIPMGATRQEIKTAYRRLARVLHPDVAPRNTDGDFITIHEAYKTLCDPKKRADYDRTLFRRQMRMLKSTWVLSAGDRNSGYTCRNWETDQCW